MSFGEEMRKARRLDLPMTSTEAKAFREEANQLIEEAKNPVLIKIKKNFFEGIITGRITYLIRPLDEAYEYLQVLNIKWTSLYIQILERSELKVPRGITKDVAFKCGFRRAAILLRSLKDEHGDLPDSVWLYKIRYLGEKT